MQCGGSTKKMAKGGSIAAGIPYASGAGATDGKNGMMRKGGAVKKMQTGGGIYKPTPINDRTKSAIKKLDNAPSNTTVGEKLKKKYNSVVDKANTNTTKGPILKPSTSTMKKGGMVKNAKLAALAAPKNKITRADVIVGAKRNAKKK
jgi:hypothetical protein